MSAQVEEYAAGSGSTDGQLALAPEPVEVRRNALLMGVVGALAAAVAIAYLSRATAGGSPWDWVVTVGTALVAVLHLGALVDSRTPLLVADAQGVRMRLGRTWRGLPWSALRGVEHTPRRWALGDGRLVLVPHTTERFLAELDTRGRRQARITTRLYGAPLAVPLGPATRSTTDEDRLAESLRDLAGPGVDVLTVVPGAERTGHDPRPAVAGLIGRAARLLARDRLRERVGGTVEEPEDEHGDETPEDVLDVVEDAPADRHQVGTPVADAHAGWDAEVPGGSEDTGDTGDTGAAEDAVDPASPAPDPVRDARLAQRVQRTRAAEVREADPEDTQPLGRVLRRPGSISLVEDTRAWGDRVRPIAKAGSPVPPLVIDEFAAEPADDPVVGPELRAARTRLGLTVDGLAERTRIRPHVIESMEVDDFAPCGGDFYARGHLRTLARVLGVDAAPLLERYDERYAHAPVSPRRVFEAELATGSHGGIRGTRGGPNWSVLVAAVMAVVLAWSVARLVMDEPAPLQGVPTLRDGSGGLGGTSSAGAETMPLLLRAASGGARVVVQDGNGKTVFTGDLSYGATRSLDVVPPARVESSDGGVEVVADGVEKGQLGETGKSATGTFVAR